MNDEMKDKLIKSIKMSNFINKLNNKVIENIDLFEGKSLIIQTPTSTLLCGQSKQVILAFAKALVGFMKKLEKNNDSCDIDEILADIKLGVTSIQESKKILKNIYSEEDKQ